MVLGINNFFDAKNKNSKVADFQDLDHLDGVSVSAVSAIALTADTDTPSKWSKS